MRPLLCALILLAASCAAPDAKQPPRKPITAVVVPPTKRVAPAPAPDITIRLVIVHDRPAFIDWLAGLTAGLIKGVASIITP